MKKSLVKLVAVSMTSMSLAAVALPSVGAYYKADSGTEYQTLTNVDQATYGVLLPELSGKIADVRAQIPGAIADVDAAKATLANAERVYGEKSQAYADAKAAYESALAKLEAAKVEQANAIQALNDLTASYGEYTVKATALEQTRDKAIDLAAETRATEVAQAENSAAPAIAAYNEAVLALNTANQKVVDAEADPNFPADSLAELKAQALAANTAATTAENNMVAAVTARDLAITAANNKEAAAVSAANAAYTTGMFDLNRIYNVTDIYGLEAKIEAATNRKNAADTAVTNAEQKVTSTLGDMTAAFDELKVAEEDLTTAQLDLAEKQAVLAKLYNDKAYYENNLHELVVGSQANSTLPSEINITKEQQDIIEEITGKTSEELAKALEEAQKDLADAEAERDKLRGEKQPDGEVDPTKPGTEVDPTKPGTEVDPTKPSTDKDTKEDGKKVTKKTDSAKLPETGEATSYAIFGAAALSILAGLGLIAPKFNKEN